MNHQLLELVTSEKHRPLAALGLLLIAVLALSVLALLLGAPETASALAAPQG